ncbi:MAG: peptidoglycan DD-metalloendopeptidase family protein [candidate division Zixibacteria bacterium]|nr:peptidoglycan DD-metalloendopeptidase family protein [candidate division Zixibacteria bacterium]
MRISSATISAFAWLLLSAVVTNAEQQRGNILGQKKELEQIRSEVEQGKNILDSLKSEELGAQKRISEYDQKIASNRKVITRLSGQLGRIRVNIDEADQQLVENQRLFQETRQRFLDNVRRFYFAARQPAVAVSDRPNHELGLHRQIVYLTALADYESGTVDAASGYLSASLDHLDELTGERKKVASMKSKRETATSLDGSRKKQQQRQLQMVQRKKTEEADRILMLQQAAREMEAIIARLEQERQKRQAAEKVTPGQPSVFATLEGQLLPPYRGRIVTPFGASVDPVTNLRSFSPGVVINGKSGRQVAAVASGIVAYIGELRGYGNFVIIDHDGEYYSTYAGLGRVSAAQNQYVQAGEKLAVAGSDGMVKFELRRGRTPLDPVKWIRIDSY